MRRVNIALPVAGAADGENPEDDRTSSFHAASRQSSESCRRSAAAVAITRVSDRRSTNLDRGESNAIVQESARKRTATLEAENRELEAFVHSVGHELRAPLRAIDGFTKLLLEHWNDRLGAKAQHYLDCILSAEQRMKGLIDALLRLSRLEQTHAERRELDLHDMVLEIVEELRTREAHREVKVVIAHLPRIQGDPVLIRQVFDNLLSNAFKFTRSRSVARIQVGYFADNGDVVYYVRDNGAGFDMHYAHRLFGLFERLHRADEFEGTGIGLALVRRIVERHGGRVWAEGACDIGATLYLALPQDRPLPDC